MGKKERKEKGDRKLNQDLRQRRKEFKKQFLEQTVYHAILTVKHNHEKTFGKRMKFRFFFSELKRDNLKTILVIKKSCYPLPDYNFIEQRIERKMGFFSSLWTQTYFRWSVLSTRKVNSEGSEEGSVGCNPQYSQNKALKDDSRLRVIT